jgi:serine/threonine-protein kinase
MREADAETKAPAPGDVLVGKYRIERIIGQGGMGVVVAAHHLSLDERVAIKFLLPEGVKNAEATARFAREARAAVKIKSEHVARVTDVGELPNGSPYMVMEYLEGCDLHGLLTLRGAMDVAVAVSYVLEACEALAEAHALGIVHRDLKPANLFLANRPSGPPTIKVLDFGISKSSLSVTQPQLTRTTAVMGSPLYMSPEQMQSSKSVDARSDIWALGVVLYELVSGKPPFQADTFPELVLTIVQREPAPLSTTRPDLPAGFWAVVDRCLAKDPAARFASVGDLAVALAPFGPPSSQVSVERVLHVLGTVRGSLAPVAVVSSPEGPVSSGARTLPADVFDSGGRPMLPVLEATGKPVSSDAPRRERTGRSLVGPALVGAGLLGLALVVWQTRAAPVVVAPPSVVAAPASPPVVPSTMVVAQAAPSSTEPPPVEPSSVPSLGPAPTKEAHATPTPHKPPHAAAATAATARPTCDPPFTVDGQGVRTYKPECL